MEYLARLLGAVAHVHNDMEVAFFAAPAQQLDQGKCIGQRGWLGGHDNDGLLRGADKVHGVVADSRCRVNQQIVIFTFNIRQLPGQMHMLSRLQIDAFNDTIGTGNDLQAVRAIQHDILN